MSFTQKYLFFLCALITGWLGFRYALPVLLPFLLGALLAVTAEPAVRFGTDKLRLPRWVSTGFGVTLTLIALSGILWLIGSLLVKEVGIMAKALPDLQDTALQGMELLQTKVVQLSEKLPAGFDRLISESVTSATNGSSAILEQTVLRLPGLLGSAVGKMSHGLIGLGTSILSGFLISSRLPKIRNLLTQQLPAPWQEKAVPLLRRVQKTLGGWLKAQGLLMLITYAIVSAGLLLLRVPFGPVWAIFIALVDAVPMLGTGTIMLPWALVELLRGNPLQALGLACIFGASALLRTILEPKLLGRHIGLDPLVTLLAMYAGYRFFGLWGLVLAPVTAAAVKAAFTK